MANEWGVVRFPGSLDDGDAMHALATVMGENARILWHKETTLDGLNACCCRAASATATTCGPARLRVSRR